MSSSRHPDSKLNPSQAVSNDSGNQDIYDIIAQRPMTRRDFFRVSAGAAAGVAVTATLGGVLVGSGEALAAVATAPVSPVIGFTPIQANVVPMTDAVSVPAGYTARTLVAWGDLLGKGAAWDVTQPMDEATQLKSYGAHTDGMHYFPFPGALGNTRGLLVTNSEYVDPALLNGILPSSSYATAALTLPMVRAQQAAHGLNMVEIQKQNGSWKVRRPSAFNRRVTGNTPCDISGPAAGHAMMQTAADPSGRTVLGTLNNCANGYTPWGTYLTCEENFNGYFGTASANLVAAPLTSHERRYGFAAGGFGYRWHEVDPRFDIRAAGNGNEGNRFGWVVEVDPFNPKSVPVKRTALGRFKHESAAVAVGPDKTVAYYMGDDERNEYVYKFVCAKKLSNNMAANRDLLDSGTLYVARFNADGTGVWLPLVWGQNGLTPANGFADQGEVLVKTRQAADLLGATMMDRPEWTSVHPDTLEVYLTLTNNSRRGNTPASSNQANGTTPAGSANPAVDAANPRPDNDYGHIIRWREAAGSVAATTFEWDVFIQCGDKQVMSTSKNMGGSYNKANFAGIDPLDPLAGKKLYEGNIIGDDFGAPDGLWFDKDGRLWVQTDQAGDAQGDWVNIGGNVMVCIDPATRESRRFLSGPPNCEVTGVTGTPDGKTMFVGIQHPGEDWVNDPVENSSWPDSGANGPTSYSSLPAVYKPRSGVLVVTKDDGGVVGS